MEGQVCGQYRITGKLGKGGMAEVYTAVHELIGREAAIKLLRPQMSEQRSIVKRFLQEAQAAASIEHPGIVSIYDVGYLDSGRAYIAMERLHGETLNQRLRRVGRLSIDEATRLIRQLAGVMEAAHSKKIIHRDLKPDNLFIVPDPEVAGSEKLKVLDFGLAKLTVEFTGSAITTMGSVFGTPSYMAPEQCKDSGKVDERADLYSIGCLLYRCLCGEAPFTSADPLEILRAHISQTPVPPSHRRPEIPPELDTLILRLLEKMPEDRVQSCGDLIRALDGGELPETTTLLDGEESTTLVDGDEPEARTAPTQDFRGQPEAPAAAPNQEVHDQSSADATLVRIDGGRAQAPPPGPPERAGTAGPAVPMAPAAAGPPAYPAHAGGQGLPAGAHGFAPAAEPRGPWPRAAGSTPSLRPGELCGYRQATSAPAPRASRRRVWVVAACVGLTLAGISLGALWTEYGEQTEIAASTASAAAATEQEADSRAAERESERAGYLQQAREALQARGWDRALEALDRAADLAGARDDEDRLAELRAEAQRGKEHRALFREVERALAARDIDAVLEGLAELAPESPYGEDAARALEDSRGALLGAAKERARAMAQKGECHELAEWLHDLEPIVPDAGEQLGDVVAACGKGGGRAAPGEEAEAFQLGAKQKQKLLADSKAAYSKGDYTRAYSLCRKILRADRDHAEGNLWCTLSACKQKQVYRARRHFPRLPDKYEGVVRQTCLKQGVKLAPR